MRVASWVEHGPLVADVVHHREGVLRPDLDDVLQRDVLARLGVLERTLKPERHQDDQVLHVLLGQVRRVEKEVEPHEVALGVVDVKPERNGSEVERLGLGLGRVVEEPERSERDRGCVGDRN